MKHSSLWLAAALALSAGSAVQAQDSGQPAGKTPGIGPGDDNSYFHAQNRQLIPKTSIPPAGQCTIWYPEKKNDEQPQPFKCSTKTKVAPGGFLISPSRDPNYLEVSVYDEQKEDHVIARASFDRRSRMIVRVLNPDQPLDAKVPGTAKAPK